MTGHGRFLAVLGGLWLLMGLASLRFEPPEFRPWERLYDREAHRFEAGRRVEMIEVGDLGYKTWVRALQHARPTRFTTDAFGFRNPPELGDARIVVIGDSYVAGSGLSDEETVTARLGARLGEPVYNFAMENLNGPALFLREGRFAREKPDVVVYAPVARGIRPRPLVRRSWARPAPPDDLLSRSRRVGEALADTVRRLDRDNGLGRECRFLFQGLRHALLGHPQEIRTPSGERALALSLVEQGLMPTAEQRRVEEVVGMLVAFDRILGGAGVRLVFSPIPESGTIYPELFPEAERRAVARPSFLDRLIARTREEGLEVVDLRPVFRGEPEPYLFQPDDSHWNARATDLAAAAWAERIRALPRVAERGR